MRDEGQALDKGLIGEQPVHGASTIFRPDGLTAGAIFLYAGTIECQFAEDGFAARTRNAGPAESGEKEQFRARFRHALGRCLQKGFLLEDCFGMIWSEAMEAMPLTEADQSELLEELGDWAQAQRESGAA